jgi:hypothetical protein
VQVQGTEDAARTGGAQISTGNATTLDGAQSTEEAARTGGAQISTGNATTLSGAQDPEEAVSADAAQAQGPEEAASADAAQAQGPEEAASADAAQAQGTEEAASADAAQAAPSPEVAAAVEDINAHDAGPDAYALTNALGGHGSNSPEDVDFRQGLMTALGPDRVAEMLGNVSSHQEAPVITQTLLTAAAEAYPVEDLGRVAQAVGPETLGATLESAVREAGFGDATEQIRATAQELAQAMGSLYSLPEGAPGRATATEAMARIQGGQHESEVPGVSTAAWLVANSGNDQMRTDFANQYLNEFKADQDSLAPEEARAVAWALGSVSAPGTGSIDPIMDLDAAQRTRFLEQLTESEETPELEGGFQFGQDARAGVNEFLSDVAGINPEDFGPDGSVSAQNLRLQTFQTVTEAVDGDFFDDSEGTHVALAEMFRADTGFIVNESVDVDSDFHDQGGATLSKFFDHVGFRSESPAARGHVRDALQNYLGVGEAEGIVDQLARNQGAQEYMGREGNRLGRNMGFLLGALHQGAQSAMENIGDEYEQKRAMMDIMGSLVETAISRDPRLQAAYQAIKSGSNDHASVDRLFTWMGEQFLGTGESEIADVKALSGGIIAGAWQPFFSDRNIQGADTERLTAMIEWINNSIALGVGAWDSPVINGGQ